MPNDKTPQTGKTPQEYNGQEYALVRRIALALKELNLYGLDIDLVIADARGMMDEDFDEF